MSKKNLKKRNKAFTNVAKMIVLFTIVLASISCNTKSSEKEGFTKNIVLEVQRDTYKYKVYENHSKVNSDDIEQCEKFFEYHNNLDGFEVYGADIADLFAVFLNISRKNVTLENKKAVFYTVLYNGEHNDSIKKEILNYLLDKRSLEVIEFSSEVDAFNLLVGDTDKLIKYRSNDNSGVSNKVSLKTDYYELTNANLKILETILNELYPNTFFYEGSDNTKYDFKIPLGLDTDAMIEYLIKTYGVDSQLSVITIKSYAVKDKL